MQPYINARDTVKKLGVQLLKMVAAFYPKHKKFTASRPQPAQLQVQFPCGEVLTFLFV